MSKRKHDSGVRRSSRRAFAKSCVLAAATPLLGGIAVPAEKPQKPQPALPATVEALMEIVRIRYGKHLAEEQLPEVQRAIGQNLLIAERLRRFPLKNSDEPSFVFRAEVS